MLKCSEVGLIGIFFKKIMPQFYFFYCKHLSFNFKNQIMKIFTKFYLFSIFGLFTLISCNKEDQTYNREGHIEDLGEGAAMVWCSPNGTNCSSEIDWTDMFVFPGSRVETSPQLSMESKEYATKKTPADVAEIEIWQKLFSKSNLTQTQISEIEHANYARIITAKDRSLVFVRNLQKGLNAGNMIFAFPRKGR